MQRGVVFGLGLTVVTVLLLGQYHAADAQGNQWGTVKGKIVWGGPNIPKQQPIAAVKINNDRMACEMGGNIVMDESFVVNPKNKGLRWTFVWLAQKDPNNPKSTIPLSIIHPSLKDIKDKKVILDQPLCAFIPHALAMRKGQELVAKNSSAIGHNLKWTGIVNPGNNVLIPPGQSFAIKDLLPEKTIPLKIECNIHPWMSGWVRIFDHPYFAVTDADGAFEIKDAPAGACQLIVSHGEGGWLGGAAGKNGKTIDIKAGGVTDLGDIAYPPPG